MKEKLKKLLPHFIAVIVFLVISCIYFKPALQGKALEQGDIKHVRGVSKETKDFRKKTGEEALWNGSMFSGMPAYQIGTRYKGNVIDKIDRAFKEILPHPAYMLLICLLCSYFLFIVLGVNYWLAFLGAIAFSFSSYFFIIIEAGHNAKALAIAYCPAVLAGVVMVFRKQYLIGFAVLSFFIALEVNANHVQITYYFFLLMIIYGLVKLYECYKEKDLKHFAKAIGIMALATVLGVATNTSRLWSTYDYAKKTIRGKSELTFDKINQTDGLDKDYATQWSYGVSETMTLMIPNFKGGGSGAIGQTNKDVLDEVNPQYKQAVASMDKYWGDQPFTSGPVYLGAVIVFLAVFGFFVLKGSLITTLLLGTVLSILLSWGKNFMPLTEFMLDYFPMYNKFRAVSMTLVIAQLAIPIVACLALHKIFSNKSFLKEKTKIPFITKAIANHKLLIISFLLTGGIALIFFLAPDFADLEKTNEYEMLSSQLARGGNTSQEQISNYLSTIMPEVKEARKAILSADAGRSFLFIALAFGLVFLLGKNKPKAMVLLITVLVLIDMWAVAWRNLSYENFGPKQNMEVPYQPNQANLSIMQDNDPNFRVFNTLAALDQDSRTSYFHKSLGGYHAAKLRRYQETIEFHIRKGNRNVINMLNAKYIITQGDGNQPIAQQNPNALGNAWFVKEVKYVATPDSEIVALNNFNPATTAIVNEKYKEELQGFNFVSDSTANIVFESYQPNHLVYTSDVTTEQLAVFSEVYYPDGWQAYVDGNPVNHFGVNYILRAMLIPKGKHKIEFKFEPKEYIVGEKISLASSVLLILLLIGGVVIETRRRKALAEE